MMKRFVLLIFVLCLITPSAWAQESSLHHLPVPRWAILASKEINLRTGPGKRYPIDWVLKNKNMPVEIIQEFDHWRRIREPSGADGWIHRSMLASTRYGMVTQDTQVMYANPTTQARVVAQLGKNVLVRLDSCRSDWCRVSVETHKGWLPKTALWGVYPTEVID